MKVHVEHTGAQHENLQASKKPMKYREDKNDNAWGKVRPRSCRVKFQQGCQRKPTRDVTKPKKVKRSLQNVGRLIGINSLSQTREATWLQDVHWLMIADIMRRRPEWGSMKTLAYSFLAREKLVSIKARRQWHFAVPEPYWTLLHNIF